MVARVAVLASGGGSNLQAIIDAVADGRLPAEVVAVVSDRPDAGALVRAERAGIPAIAVPRRRDEPRGDYDTRLADVVAAIGPDLVVLAGWMRILTMAFLGALPRPRRQPPPGAARASCPGSHADRAGVRRGPRRHAHEHRRDGPPRARRGRRRRPGARHGRRADPRDRHPRRRSPPASTPPSTTCSSTCSPRSYRKGSDDTPTTTPCSTASRPSRSTTSSIVPGYSEALPDAVDTAATFAAGITLAIPLVSAAMDKVTEAAWRSRWPATAASA